jgi:hypothetical protein
MEKISTASATAPEASPMAIYGTMILGQILHALASGPGPSPPYVLAELQPR